MSKIFFSRNKINLSQEYRVVILYRKKPTHKLNIVDKSTHNDSQRSKFENSISFDG